jgi:hypothetical protein
VAQFLPGGLIYEINLSSEIAEGSDAADSERQSLQHQAYYSIEATYVAFGVNPSLDGARELKVHESKHTKGYSSY